MKSVSFFANVYIRVILGVSVLAISSDAAAVGPAGMPRAIEKYTKGQFIELKRATLAPMAHTIFCFKNPSDCRITDEDASKAASSNDIEQLSTINNSVNHTMVATNDNSAEVDVWTVGQERGDCEDFALTKRRDLIAAGWPPRLLRIAVARTRSGEGHAVLIARTLKGDMVLDNRTDAIKLWSLSGLQFLKIQSGDNPLQWFDI